MLAAFKEHRLAERHFVQTTGYGYNDEGREVTDKIYATIFGAGTALVRSQFFSGTHAIVTALFGVLRPGDCTVSITNTLLLSNPPLIAQGVRHPRRLRIYRQINLLPGGIIDTPQRAPLRRTRKMVYLQRLWRYESF